MPLIGPQTRSVQRNLVHRGVVFRRPSLCGAKKAGLAGVGGAREAVVAGY